MELYNLFLFAVEMDCLNYLYCVVFNYKLCCMANIYKIIAKYRVDLCCKLKMYFIFIALY